MKILPTTKKEIELSSYEPERCISLSDMAAKFSRIPNNNTTVGFFDQNFKTLTVMIGNNQYKKLVENRAVVIYLPKLKKYGETNEDGYLYLKEGDTIYFPHSNYCYKLFRGSFHWEFYTLKRTCRVYKGLKK